MNLTKGSASAISSLPNLGVYKEHVIYQPHIDCYDRAGHLLEFLLLLGATRDLRRRIPRDAV